MNLIKFIQITIAAAAVCIILLVDAPSIAENDSKKNETNVAKPTVVPPSDGGDGLEGKDAIKPPKIVPFKKPSGPLPSWMTDEGNFQAEKIAEEAITKLMRKKVRPDFNNTPLRVVIEAWATELNIPIVIDTVALEGGGDVTAEDPVTLTGIPEISFRSALKLVLNPKELTYVIEDEVMKITTKDQGSAKVRRMYDLSYILTSYDRIDELIFLIHNTVSANWDIDGGEDVIATFGPVLVVCCSLETQYEIESLLYELSKMSTENF